MTQQRRARPCVSAGSVNVLRHSRIDAIVIAGVQEPVRPDRPKAYAARRRSPRCRMPCASPAPDAAPALDERYHAIRPEGSRRQPQASTARQSPSSPPDASSNAASGASNQPQGQRDPGPDRVRRGARRRRERVRRHQVLGRDDVRQGRPRARPAGTGRLPRRPGRRRTAANRSRRPAAIAATPTAPTARSAVTDEQHLPAPPPVEQHPDPGADDGERQQQHGEGRRDPPRGRLLLRVEEEQAGQGHLEDAVPALPGQPDRQQPAEPGPRARCRRARIRSRPDSRRGGSGQFDDSTRTRRHRTGPVAACRMERRPTGASAGPSGGGSASALEVARG